MQDANVSTMGIEHSTFRTEAPPRIEWFPLAGIAGSVMPRLIWKSKRLALQKGGAGKETGTACIVSQSRIRAIPEPCGR